MRLILKNNMYLYFIIGIVCASLCIIVYIFSGNDSITSSNTQTKIMNKLQLAGVSGSLFKPLNRTIDVNDLQNSLSLNKGKHEILHESVKWIVTTSIRCPSDIEALLHDSYEKWKLVVVADKKTCSSWSEELSPKLKKFNTVFLSVEKQKDLWYNIINFTPYNSFARKNIGYLYAIERGAKCILDIDDDNILLNNAIDLDCDQPPASLTINSKSLPTVNPYTFFYDGMIWPRGYPLDYIKKQNNYTEITNNNNNEGNSQPGVIQYLQHLDPDVDAIFRLSQLPFKQWMNRQTCITIDTENYSPFNAQSTLVYQSSFPLLILPATVHGRVADIWRSYITEKIMSKYHYSMKFCNPVVNHMRNVHNYLADFQAEIPLYLQSTVLVNFLHDYELKCNNPTECLSELYYKMYSHGYIEEDDLKLVNAWITDLHNLGIQ